MHLKVRLWNQSRPDQLSTHAITRRTIFGTPASESGFAIPTHSLFLSIRPEELLIPRGGANSPSQERHSIRQWLAAELRLHNGWTIEELLILREPEGAAVFRALDQARRNYLTRHFTAANDILD